MTEISSYLCDLCKRGIPQDQGVFHVTIGYSKWVYGQVWIERDLCEACAAKLGVHPEDGTIKLEEEA